ncbi:hypothetical protein CBR_g24296 [Chara braunii]|uniref:Uncharacterized protein n=1 Tax=Chara braunii TaxID=69332 RepID=A0A388JMG9_CHABU|nr:hypothetical protein CBR_g24296 [Chara braunii]|eukprot:GBG58945.1 hypothetical protein CBR_g24296 [Chara braunii]
MSLLMAFFLSKDTVVTANAAPTSSGNREPLDNLITQWESAAEAEFAYLHLSQLEVLRRIKLGRLNVNPTAAVAYASHFVIRTFHWEKQASLDMMLQTQLRPLNLTKQQKITARRFAIRVALPIVRNRIGNDILEYQDRQPAPANGPPGVYQSTPGQLFFLNGLSGGAPPLIADKPEAYRSAIPGPPPVPSPEYNRDLREVREYGALFGSRRNQEQDQVLNFAQSLDVNTYTRMWAIVAKQILPHNISLYDTAYVFAAMAIVQQDGIASVFDNKWYHFFWRPVTAIRYVI